MKLSTWNDPAEPKFFLALTVYVAAVVAANVMTAHLGLVNVGFGLLVTAGTFAAGFALLARDFVQRYGGVVPVVLAILVAGVLSFFLASHGLAFASVVAFLGAELVDLAVFTPLKARVGFISSAFISNLVSAPLDTVLFLWIASFPVTWNAIEGQFIGKIVWATIIPIVLYIVGSRVVLRQPVDADRT